MEQVLNPNQKKIESHGIKSVRARVGALRAALGEEHKDITVEELTDFLLKEFLEVSDLNDAKRYVLTDEDWANIDAIADKTYNNWDWNYGRFKEFQYQVNERFEGVGTLHIGLTIKEARIDDIQINGDFFSIESMGDLQEALTGVKLRKEDMLEALSEFNFSDYISNLSAEEFVNYILEIPANQEEGEV